MYKKKKNSNITYFQKTIRFCFKQSERVHEDGKQVTHCDFSSLRPRRQLVGNLTLTANMRAFYNENALVAAAVHSIEKLQLWLICVHFVF